MWTFQEYIAAFVFISVSGLWAITCWQLSEFLADKRRWSLAAKAKFNKKPNSKPKMARAMDAKKSFLAWNAGVSTLIVTMLIFCLLWVRASELNSQREDVVRHIEISYSIPAVYKNDATHSQITVTNNSDENLTERHMVACYAILVVTRSNALISGLWFAQNATRGWLLIPYEPTAADIEKSWSISGKGTSGNKDAITESCLRMWSAEVKCADVM